MTDSTKFVDCKVCMAAHDDEIHSATLDIRSWFRGEVTKHFEDYDYEYELVEEPAVSAA